MTMKDVEEYVPVLYLKAMTFGFELGKGVKDTFEAKFARETVNDNGEVLWTEIGYVIVQEFRKLMFINAVEILKAKVKGRLDKDLNKRLGKRGWFFTAQMPAPYFIDMVWRMAVRYDFYEDYC